jgi:hypothetical protein
MARSAAKRAKIAWIRAFLLASVRPAIRSMVIWV